MDINEIEDVARAEFLQEVAGIVKYWVDLPNKTTLQRCNGVAFTIMVTLDRYGCDKPAKSFFSPGYVDMEGDDANGMDLECAGCIRLGHPIKELHGDYFKYAPDQEPGQEPGIGTAFVKLVTGLVRHWLRRR